ncbi:MAG TPA: hypothetical protein DCS28_00270 [Candidatus Moranbacteria bacterium]|nr:hypothetical protein [Candidatus Moranbacteria bacterium]HAT74468.1 hypothetical protein [Candidatus Moranbacteria bacterium]
MDKKEKLTAFIDASDLSAGDKARWIEMLNASPENFIESLQEILEQFPQELSWFNEIYKRKQAAFALFKTTKAEGQTQLKEIFEEEKKKLEELLNK